MATEACADPMSIHEPRPSRLQTKLHHAWELNQVISTVSGSEEHAFEFRALTKFRIAFFQQRIDLRTVGYKANVELPTA